MTKNQWIEKLRIELKVRNYAASSIDTYCSCLAIILDKYKKYNGYQSGDDIKAFLLTITNTNYHKQFTATFRHFFTLVLKKQFDVRDIPYPRKTHFLPVVLSIQEVQRIIAATTNIKHRALLQIIYSCGLRISEPTKIICTKGECHLDTDRKLLLVKGAKGFKDRLVPIPDPTVELLRNYWKQYKPLRLLFEGQGRSQYSTRSIQQIFKRALRKAGIYKHATPHSLRHSRATHLSDAGVDIYKIKDFLGHNNIKTTEGYLHLAKQSLVNHIANADAIIAMALHQNKELMLEMAD